MGYAPVVPRGDTPDHWWETVGPVLLVAGLALFFTILFVMVVIVLGPFLIGPLFWILAIAYAAQGYLAHREKRQLDAAPALLSAAKDADIRRRLGM